MRDFRRAIRSTLVERRWCSPAAAELALGRKLPGIIGVYDVGNYDDERANALDRWASFLDTLAGFGEASVVNLDAQRSGVKA